MPSIWDLQNHCLTHGRWSAAPGSTLGHEHGAQTSPEGKDSTRSSLTSHWPPGCLCTEPRLYTQESCIFS